jgi:hypothetical protein
MDYKPQKKLYEYEIEQKVEIWNHKKYLVARDERGRISSFKKYKRKEYKSDIKYYENNNTYVRGARKERLSNVTENVYMISGRGVSGKIKKPRIKRTYQYVIEAELQDGTEFTVRSLKHVKGYPYNQARDEAIENLYYVGSELSGGAYDADEGKERMDRGEFKIINEQVVEYT